MQTKFDLRKKKFKLELSFKIPEFEELVYLELLKVTDGAVLNKSNTIATLKLAASDNPYGYFKFSKGSRLVLV